MIVLRLTKKLLTDMKIKETESFEGAKLLSWHVNIYKLNNRKHIVFANDVSKLAIIIDGVRSGQVEKLKQTFLVTLKEYLLVEGVPLKHVEWYMNQASDVLVTKTNDRVVLGTMNDITFFDEDDFESNMERMMWLNRRIYKSIDYKEPIVHFVNALISSNRTMDNVIMFPKR